MKVAAPFVPFITEEIYQNLKTDGMSESVHLCDFPEVQTGRRDAELEHKMALTQQAVSMGRAIRSMHNLKVRQPLNAIHLVTRDRDEKNILIEMEDIIREELNVKEVIFRDNEEDLVEYSAKANFRELGRKLGKDMKEAAAAIAKFSGSEIQSLLDGNTLSLDVAGDSIDLTIDSIIVQREEKEGLKVLNEGSLTVALDPVVTEELRQEGLVRDLVRGIQNMRKDSGLQVTDRINLVINAAGELAESIGNFEDYVKAEVLCDNLEISSEVQAAELESGEAKVSLTLSVVD